jgi:hypothetical protein
VSDFDPCPACDESHDPIDWNSLGMLCGRCRQHTGNNHQGHYWSLCKALMAQGRGFHDSLRGFHFCCPGDCELEDSA